MKTIHQRAIAPYTPEQLFALVNDVSHYPEFVPYCSGADILAQTDDLVRAKLTFAKGPIRQSVTTENHLTPFSDIRMTLVSGPFSDLNGHWHFQALNLKETQIDFELRFHVANPMLKAMAEPFFTSIAEKMVDAFVNRAKQLSYDSN